MSTISASTTSTTAYKVTADTTGTLVLQTGATPTTAVTIDGSQNVGIGTSSPGYKLDTQANTYQVAQFKNTNASGGDAQVTLTATQAGNGGALNATANYLAFQIASSEKARIDSSGKFTLASETLYITNIPTTSTAGNCLISSGEGNKFYRSTSSLKYKRNVVDMQRGLADVQQLRPVNFNGVSDFDGDKLFAGFIAEEVEALGFKEFVIYDENGEPDGLQYANLTALLTKAIQELKAELDAAKADIATLKGAA